jgi:hypothetical protein
MASSKAAPVAATEEGRKSRTIYVSDSEWDEINKSADAEGRKVSRHLVMLVRERAAKK